MNVDALAFKAFNDSRWFLWVAGSRVACPECGKEILRTNLSKHLRVMHSQQMEPASCPQCGKVFKSKYNMGDHLRSVHNIFRKW
jgi:endogenous inhibitor of DNA gyrase (YacG/DUF329 family)